MPINGLRLLYSYSSTALVRRYAQLSPSYLQEAVEKVSAFGKAKAPEPTKADTVENGKESATEPKEDAEALTGVSTVPKTGNFGKGGEGR